MSSRPTPSLAAAAWLASCFVAPPASADASVPAQAPLGVVALPPQATAWPTIVATGVAIGAGAYFGAYALEGAGLAGPLKATNLGLRFALELGTLGALASWGTQLGRTPWEQAALGIGAPLVAGVLWGAFVSPRAPYPAPEPLHLGLELTILGSGAGALAATGHPDWATAFATAVVVNGVLLRAWGQ